MAVEAAVLILTGGSSSCLLFFTRKFMICIYIYIYIYFFKKKAASSQINFSSVRVFIKYLFSFHIFSLSLLHFPYYIKGQNDSSSPPPPPPPTTITNCIICVYINIIQKKNIQVMQYV